MAKDHAAEVSSDAKKVPKRVAFIKGRVRARVRKEDEEMVMTVPHLVVREVIAFEVLVIVLALVSLFFNAPLEWVANPVHTPNPAKAPWYFLGLQELLHYFPPVVGGVIIPALVVIGLVVIPYFHVNLRTGSMWEERPRATLWGVLITVGIVSVLLLLYEVYAVLVPTLVLAALMLIARFLKSPLLRYLRGRPLSWWIMTWFVVNVAVLTAIGVLFRGPGWSWTWPWEGIY
jgi:menaquinol-cytochrome c reductase cytochrome b/c subunit